jgi:hypothetical protein
MTLERGAQRAIVAVYFLIAAAIYVTAWLLPGFGLFHDSALHLVTAKAIAAGHGYTIDSLPRPVPETQFPPLFSVLLALFTFVSTQALWLKALPLVCGAGWLWATRRLLLKMGASGSASLLLAALTALSPTVVFLATNLLPETLFGLLATLALLMLLEERALAAGLFAGLATLTQTPGVALIAACILTLVARRRFRGAAIFAVTAMVMVAPWFGWSLAHMTHDASSVGGVRAATNIFTGLAASEKAVVLGHNLLGVLASPYQLLTGFSSVFSAIGTVAILVWCLFQRRQMLPDLFVGLYSLALLFFIAPPERFVAPILPLFLWMVWRVARQMEVKEALAALVLIVLAIPIYPDAMRLLTARGSGYFALEGEAPDQWNEMQRLYGLIRDKATPDSVVMANMDALAFLNTGRRAVRGFAARDFDLYYGTIESPVTPDQLSRAVVESGVSYVVLTPDNDLPESASFHRSVEALERGNVVEPVRVPGVAAGYALFRVAPR